MRSYCTIIIVFLYIFNSIAMDKAKFPKLPPELYKKCIPDLECFWPKVDSYYFREWYAKDMNDLVIISLQCLQQGISLTYKERPFLALTVYKNMHKDHERFLLITKGLFSPQKGVQALLGWQLLKVLGPTVFEKMQIHHDAQRQLVEDFKNVLCMESSQLLFPHTQYGFKECPVLLNTLKQYRNNITNKKWIAIPSIHLAIGTIAI